jgi:uncharacterized protein YkwD
VGRRRAIAACLCGFLLLVPALHASDSTAASKGEQRLFEEINRVRAAHGVPLLRTDARLRAAAKAHSRDMVAEGYLNHGDFGRRLQNYGVRARVIGENVAWGQGGSVRARAIVAGWMGSSSHRANLLSRDFHRIGIGAVVGSFGGHRRAHLVTADFAA